MKFSLGFLSLLSVASISAEQIPALTDVLAAAIEEKRTAGGVLVVAGEDSILHADAQGMADISAEREMRPDDLFWIASMTKPVTGVAAMMLVEQGKLDLDAPVRQYLPEFAELRDAEGEKVSVTVRQCMNHTSGLSDLPAETRSKISTLQQLVEETVELPVLFPAGTQWKYCQTGINTVGRIIEVQSGLLLPEFFETRIFDPLKMTDTTFYPTEVLVNERKAKAYRVPDMEEVNIAYLTGKTPWDRSRYPMANGGLFSTAGDMTRFLQMVLRGGELDGVRLLEAESVAAMLEVSTGDLKVGFTPGNGWALGWCIIREPQGVTAALASGSYGHGGAHGTQMWVDPAAGRIDLMMVQRTGVKNGDAAPLREALHNGAAKAQKAR